MRRKRHRMVRKKNKQGPAPEPPDISAATMCASSITSADVIECKSSDSPDVGRHLVESEERISEGVSESVLQDANLNTGQSPSESFHLVWQDINSDPEDINALFSSLDSSKENILVRTETESSNALLELERKEKSRVATYKPCRKIRQNANRKQPRRSCKRTSSSQALVLARVETTLLVVVKQGSPGLVMSAPNCIGRMCVVAMNRFDDCIALSGCVSLALLRHEDLHVPSETWRVQLRPGTVVSVISRAALLSSHKQPSEETTAEQAQQDNLTELLAEQRAYMSQLHSVFYGSD